MQGGKTMLDKNKVGLSLGIFLAIFHAAWALMVAVMSGTLQSFLDWIFLLHSIKPVWILTSFSLVNSVLLVIVTFISGYVLGWVFAFAHNLHHKKR